MVKNVREEMGNASSYITRERPDEEPVIDEAAYLRGVTDQIIPKPQLTDEPKFLEGVTKFTMDGETKYAVYDKYDKQCGFVTFERSYNFVEVKKKGGGGHGMDFDDDDGGGGGGGYDNLDKFLNMAGASFGRMGKYEKAWPEGGEMRVDFTYHHPRMNKNSPPGEVINCSGRLYTQSKSGVEFIDSNECWQTGDATTKGEALRLQDWLEKRRYSLEDLSWTCLASLAPLEGSQYDNNVVFSESALNF